MENTKKRVIRRMIAILSCLAMLQTTIVINAASTNHGSLASAAIGKATVGMSDTPAPDLIEEPYLEVDRERVEFDNLAATSSKIKVSANTGWTVSSYKSWVLIKSSSHDGGHASVAGSGDGSFYIYVKKNSSSKQREAWITVTNTDKSLKCKILVSQDPEPGPGPGPEHDLTVSVYKKTIEKGKTTKVKFSFPEGLYPSDIESVTYSSTKKKVATVSKKGVVKGIAKGTATIKVTVKLVGGFSKTFKIKITVSVRKK